MNAQSNYKNNRVFQIFAVTLITLMALLTAGGRVSADHVVMSAYTPSFDCAAYVECGYIQMHSQPGQGFVTTASTVSVTEVTGFEHQAIFGYIQMHDRAYANVRTTRDIVLNDLAAFENLPIFGYIVMHIN